MGWFDDVMGHLVWLAKSHQQMYDDIHGGLGVNGGQGTIEHYNRADKKLQEIQERIEKGVKELSANWSGVAADGATALTRASADWAAAAAVATINARGQSLHQASAFVDAKNRMPEPVSLPDISPNGGFPAAKLIVDFVQAKERADAAHQEAARIMTNYQTSTNQHINSMPQYPPVTTAVVSTVVAADTPGGDVGSPPRLPGRSVPGQRPGSGSQPAGSGPHQQGSVPQQQGPGPGAERPPGGAPLPGSEPVPTGNQLPPKTGTSTSGFLPPSAVPPQTGGQFPAAPDVPRQGAPTPGVPVGFGGNPGGSGNPAAPGRGGVPGGVVRGPGPIEPAPGTAAARGARGAAGMPGMVQGRQNRDEDEEHQRKYVVLDDEHLLDDNPPTAPPVIGEDRY